MSVVNSLPDASHQYSFSLTPLPSHCTLHSLVPAGSPLPSGHVAVCVFDINPQSLPTPFFILFLCLFLSLWPFQLYFIPKILLKTLCCLTLFFQSYFCFYRPSNCIQLKKFSRKLSAFSLCSSGLISALLVLSTTYRFIKVSFSPDILLCGSLGLKHQLTH